MIESICLVQENRISAEQMEKLEPMLTELAKEYFSEKININWTTVTQGNGWTGVGPATGSNIALYVTDMQQNKRTRLLEDICQQWMKITGCSISEIVASAISH